MAHSDANSTDQRSFVDRLFKAYPTLVAAAKDGDAAKVASVMDDVYVAAPDASTKKIRDAQVRAAALEAIKSGKDTTLKALLDRGADLGIGESDGGGDGGEGGALTRGAASAGHAVVLDVLLDTFGLEYMYFKDAKTGRTPLLCAAANGHEACVARVLARLMDAEERDDGRRATAVVDAVDVDGNTAAMLAAENDHAGCLNQLRGAGCDMEIARESDGATAMAIHRARVLSRIRCIED